jgi:hypothetical protein
VLVSSWAHGSLCWTVSKKSLCLVVLVSSWAHESLCWTVSKKSLCQVVLVFSWVHESLCRTVSKKSLCQVVPVSSWVHEALVLNLGQELFMLSCACLELRARSLCVVFALNCGQEGIDKSNTVASCWQHPPHDFPDCIGDKSSIHFLIKPARFLYP